MTGAELFVRIVKMKEGREQPYDCSPIPVEEIEELAETVGKHLVRDDDSQWLVIFDDGSSLRIINPYQDTGPRRFEIPSLDPREIAEETECLLRSLLAFVREIRRIPTADAVERLLQIKEALRGVVPGARVVKNKGGAR